MKASGSKNWMYPRAISNPVASPGNSAAHALGGLRNTGIIGLYLPPHMQALIRINFTTAALSLGLTSSAIRAGRSLTTADSSLIFDLINLNVEIRSLSSKNQLPNGVEEDLTVSPQRYRGAQQM
jgi:hypothetical protein